MSEEATTPPDGGNAARLAGERLADARHAREIPLHDIAKQLHLDEYKVTALEQNNFEILGAPVFAKGYLKKYAELVGIPVDAILADYHRMNSSASTPLVVRHREPPPREIAPGPWLGGIAVVAIVAGAAWWWLSRGEEWLDQGSEPATLAPFAEEQPAAPGPDAVREAQSIPPPAGDPGGAVDTEEGETTASEVSSQSGVSEAQPPPGGAGTAVEGEVLLSVTFSGDCWTEITDAAGDRLYFGLGSAGRSVAVSGAPPLQVLLGNSANASLEVNGSHYPIPRTARRGDTARLTIADL